MDLSKCETKKSCLCENTNLKRYLVCDVNIPLTYTSLLTLIENFTKAKGYNKIVFGICNNELQAIT